MAQFTDFNNSLAALKSTSDIALKKDADSVKQSIKNLILTNKGERLMQPDLGCKIRNLLFENFTPQTTITARQIITETIEKYEPRAELINIAISPAPDNNYLFISILFNLINNQDQQVLDLEIERIR